MLGISLPEIHINEKGAPKGAYSNISRRIYFA